MKKIKLEQPKKALPSSFHEIQNFKPPGYKKESQKTVSFSQYYSFNKCNYQWFLGYGKKLNTYEPTIHTIFGTALHETIQEWLGIIYKESAKKANEFNHSEFLLDRMTKVYKKEKFKNNHKNFATAEQLEDIYLDGIAILEHLKKKRNVYFSKRGVELVGCEIPVYFPLENNTVFKGYIDVLLYSPVTEKFLILDIKTSTKGWSDFEKKDEHKIAQLVLYKNFLSKQFNIPIESIDIEYFIVRRKLYEGGEFIPKRVQHFKPASGKVKVKKVQTYLQNFILTSFLDNGEPNLDSSLYKASPSKSTCMFCPFNTSSKIYKCEFAHTVLKVKYYDMEDQLTSVHINKDLLLEFKSTGLRYKVKMRELIERSMYLYVTDPNFRNQINSQLKTTINKSTLK